MTDRGKTFAAAGYAEGIGALVGLFQQHLITGLTECADLGGGAGN